MAFDPHANLAVSAVSTAPSPPTSGTSLTVNAGHGVRFPAVPFNATVWPVAVAPTPVNAEIIRVTARTTDTLTILRAQEGTPARAIGSGDQIAATITAKTLTDVETEFAAYARLTAANTFTTNQILTAPIPAIIWNDTSQSANSRLMYWQNANQVMSLNATDDGYGSGVIPLAVTRTGDTKTSRDFYEKNRTTPIGHWQALTPTLETDSGSVVLNTSFGCRYTLIGKTLTILFFFQITITGTPTAVTLNLPAGLTAADYSIMPFGRGTTIGIARCNPGSAAIGLQTNMLATPWAAEAIYIGGTVTVAIT